MLNKRIDDALVGLEEKHNIRILYACESGSRAWGFASPDSDFDIRFIYLRPQKEYLALNPKPDTIEHMDGELDIAGWDLKKGCGLLYNSNPSLLEWLRSDIQYWVHRPFMRDVIDVYHKYFIPKRSLRHYFHMARGNYRKYIENKPRINLKRYLYVLRPIIVMQYIYQFGVFPGLNFEYLMNHTPGIPENIQIDITHLLAYKRDAIEISDFEANHALVRSFERYVLEQFEYFEPELKGPEEKLDYGPVNDLFFRWHDQYRNI